MKITELMKSKFFSILSLTILCSMLASASTASAGDRASATASMYKQQSALAGGVVVHGGYDFVTEIRAYFELYRDGTYLGSKLDVSDNYYLDQYATAHITDGAHTQSGSYKMQWSGRVKGYYSNGSDWSDSGEKTYYLN